MALTRNDKLLILAAVFLAAAVVGTLAWWRTSGDAGRQPQPLPTAEAPSAPLPEQRTVVAPQDTPQVTVQLTPPAQPLQPAPPAASPPAPATDPSLQTLFTAEPPKPEPEPEPQPAPAPEPQPQPEQPAPPPPPAKPETAKERKARLAQERKAAQEAKRAEAAAAKAHAETLRKAQEELKQAEVELKRAQARAAKEAAKDPKGQTSPAQTPQAQTPPAQAVQTPEQPAAPASAPPQQAPDLSGAQPGPQPGPQSKPEPKADSRPAPGAPRNTVERVGVSQSGNSVVVILHGAASQDKAEAMLLESPPRLVVDLPGAWTLRHADRPGGELVGAVRVGKHPDKLRLVLDLTFSPKGPKRPQVEKTAEGFVITIAK